MPEPLRLSAATVGGYLEQRGLASPGTVRGSRRLAGGVSNEVVGVETDRASLVVKQALPRLRVEDEWLADVDRIEAEADALRLVGAITPGLVPDVVDLDAASHVLTITMAPRGWVSWKDSLLLGSVDPAVAHTLGTALGQWHAHTAAKANELGRFDNPVAFEQLRIDPYHRTTARRLPGIGAHIDVLVEKMAARRIALVHGDFSPKNVLVGPEGCWVLDWEVAHLGDPAFDVAFMLNHLALKAVRSPELEREYWGGAAAFLAAYDKSAGLGMAGGEAHIVAHLGALLLARVLGKSPVEYLDRGAKAAVIEIGTGLLRHRPTTVHAAWGSVAALRSRVSRPARIAQDSQANVRAVPAATGHSGSTDTATVVTTEGER